jgi:hypothetical protein
MSLQKATPLKVGLLIVALAYLLFNAHSLFNLSWVGEWNRIVTNNPTLSFEIYIEDITAAVGVAFRFAAGIIAVVAAIYYFSKGLPSTDKLYKILKVVIVFEAIYWFGLTTTAGVDIRNLAVSHHLTITSALNSLASTVIPDVVESIALPIILLVLAYKLNSNKVNQGIKWALIAGTLMIFTFWLTNSSIWIYTFLGYGTKALTNYTVNTIAFASTVIGLLALAIYSSWFTVKSRKVISLTEVHLKRVGVIITAFGLFFLWNYLTWIFFGGDYLWSSDQVWYAWFLGHNLDLWMLSLPLLGLPLLFSHKNKEEKPSP